MCEKSIKLTVVIAALAILSTFGVPASAAPEGTLVVGMEADPYAMDPLAAWMTYGMVIMRQIYDTVIDFGPNGELNPRLATSWEQPDDLTWRFHLRKGVKFHNGYPFTAEDFKFSLERILDPENKCRYRDRYLTIDKIIAVDDHTIEIKTKTPDALLPNRLAFFVRVIPKKWVEENGVDTLRKQAMGTGPFKFVEWARKDHLTLEANTDHYQTAPKIKTLIFRPIPETASRMAELQAGGAHIVTNVPPFMVPQLEKDPNAGVQNVLSLRSIFMGINTLSVPELKDKRVRQALNYAVDKDAIIKGVLSGMGKAQGIAAAQQVHCVDKSIKPYPYDPAKAKALLMEAGYPGGFELNLFSPSGRYPMDKEVVQAVADQLTKIGIKSQVQVLETQKYFRDFTTQKLNGIFIIGHGLLFWDQDPLVSFVDPKSSYCHYHNPEVEKLIHQMRSLLKTEERCAVAHEIQQIINEEAVHLFLYNQVNSYGVSKKVNDFHARADDHMDLWQVNLME